MPDLMSFLDMSPDFMKKNELCYIFTLKGHIKQDRPGKMYGNVRLYKYEVGPLCVYRTLVAYLETTSSIRKSSSLLVSYVKPQKEVSTTTIGRWIKCQLSQAGIDTKSFTAHRTPSASRSKVQSSIAVDVIMSCAGWTKESTFRKWYSRPLGITDDLSVATG